MLVRRSLTPYLAGLAVAGALIWRRVIRLEIEGESMLPSLLPGDRVVAVKRRPRVGDVVALRDPRNPARTIVKRMVAVGEGGALIVRGDNEAASTDSRAFGAVPRALVLGVVVYCYAPGSRSGRVTRITRFRDQGVSGWTE